jgi:DtxR family Mn-dependent transcriptional regulator
LTTKQQKDEHLERIWYAKERQEGSLEEFRGVMGSAYSAECLQQLASDGFVEVDENSGHLDFTEKGREYTKQLIRAHRIAERLIHDVLGRDFESGACEFEHIVDTDLVDSICTLLGHPRECPHGFPIPMGECCKRSARTVQSAVLPLAEMQIGQSGHIAHVYAESDQQLHRLDSLQIRPGARIRLHQVYPSFVVECEGASVALDAQVAAKINVMVNSRPGTGQFVLPLQRRGLHMRRRRGRRFRR